MTMGVLDGIKILELGRVPPAELPWVLLADMGADVLKIETPEPDRPQGEEWVRRTIQTFNNRNKRPPALNIEAAAGQALFREPPPPPGGEGGAADDPHVDEPQQAAHDAEHEIARGPGALQEARRDRGRDRRGLPARRDEAAPRPRPGRYGDQTPPRRAV